MAEAENTASNAEPLHTSVSAGFNQHTPAYWRLMLPTLAARYVFRWVDKFFELEHKAIPGIGLKTNRFYDVAVGAGTLATTAFFAARTGSDMRNMFAEAVAYEFNKDPQDIGFNDILASQNKAVIKARSNLIKYTGLRALVNSTFFVSLLPGKFSTTHADPVDLGVGANGAYLVSEVMLRDATFFEQLQDFADRKINQRHALGDAIKGGDLVKLFERNARDNDPENAFDGKLNTPVWHQSQVIFERMAELMNCTYQMRNDKDNSDFTLPKFLYLLGHGLIQPKQVEQTLAYIEVANQYGIDAVKEVAKNLKTGSDLGAALKDYPVDLSYINENAYTVNFQEKVAGSKKSVLPQENNDFSQKICATKRPTALPLNHVDKLVAQSANMTPGSSGISAA